MGKSSEIPKELRGDFWIICKIPWFNYWILYFVLNNDGHVEFSLRNGLLAEFAAQLCLESQNSCDTNELP